MLTDPVDQAQPPYIPIDLRKENRTMKKLSMFVVFAVLLISLMFLASPQPVIAQTPTPTPKPVYVDPYRPDGNEDGMELSPYSTLEEGIAYAQAQPYGGRLYVRNADGTWRDFGVIDAVAAGRGGTAVPELVIYALLMGLAVIMIVLGRRLQRGSKQLRS
jgi:hypothetical protein